MLQELFGALSEHEVTTESSLALYTVATAVAPKPNWLDEDHINRSIVKDPTAYEASACALDQ
jgi:hypothetical protein